MRLKAAPKACLAAAAATGGCGPSWRPHDGCFAFANVISFTTFAPAAKGLAPADQLAATCCCGARRSEEQARALGRIRVGGLETVRSQRAVKSNSSVSMRLLQRQHHQLRRHPAAAAAPRPRALLLGLLAASFLLATFHPNYKRTGGQQTGGPLAADAFVLLPAPMVTLGPAHGTAARLLALAPAARPGECFRRPLRNLFGAREWQN